MPLPQVRRRRVSKLPARREGARAGIIPWVSPFDENDFLEVEDTFVGDLPELNVEPPTEEEIAAEEGVVEVAEFKKEEITAPHDGGEWLTGFHAGHRGLRADYDRAVREVAKALGYADWKGEEIARDVARRALGDPPNKKGGG